MQCLQIYFSLLTVKVVSLPIIEKNVGALYVSMKEVSFVTESKAIKQLFHERRYVTLSKWHKSRLEQSHQVMVHVFKYQIESTWNTEQSCGKTSKYRNIQ